MSKPSCIALATVILGFGFSDLPAHPQELPPLLALLPSSLAEFQPSVREQIQRALEAAQRNPQDAETVGHLGMILHAYEKFELAGVCYERAQGLDPSQFRWLYYLGLVKQRLGEAEKSVAYLRRAVDQQPAFVPARIRLAESLRAAGKVHESRQAYEQILAEEPGAAVAYYGLGEVFSALGDPHAALQNYRRASELAPEFGAVHYALALKYRDLGKKVESQKHFSLYYAHKGTEPPLEDALVDSVHALAVGAVTRFERGRRLEQNGELEEAAAEYERTLELDPTFGQAHVNLISLYALMGRLDEAEAHYRKGLEVNPNLAELHYNYALLLTRRNRYSEASQAFRKALELNPYFADAHNNLGSMLEQEGKTSEAEHYFRLAVENNPGHRLAHFNLGRLLVRQSRHQDAIRHFLKTLAVRDEKTPTFLYVLADAYVRAGDLPKGLHHLEQAIQEAKSLDQEDLATRMEKDLRELRQRGNSPRDLLR